ncbi:DUF4325 domain-containing protein [Acinetobacter sp. WCHA55]|uniref:STAS-like domain-containing protein n=1 Tax=Acinetobacter sp. WCHA55 TaxID=2004646 RepID=UPI000B3C7224|nr:STAS-like domain-containing protein [Acinetobacter sp. WCHA55]AYA70327.1 DUF4325 domain-containing protein [Acinetobacter sp. WCHA55]
MDNHIRINVGEQFYPRPAGRFYTDGEHSGQKFREEVLVPNLKKLTSGQKLILDFSLVTMAGSSFLEESFGGLVRVEGFDRKKLHQVLEIISPRKIIKDRIFEYIDDAKFN